MVQVGERGALVGGQKLVGLLLEVLGLGLRVRPLGGRMGDGRCLITGRTARGLGEEALRALDDLDRGALRAK